MNAKRLAAIQTLAVDAQTVEVVSAFRNHHVEPLLLKGPAIARLLYADGEARSYGDSDLLVSPGTLSAAEEALCELGFERAVGVRAMALIGSHGYPWRRPGSRLAVDLHHTLPGVEAPPGELWTALHGHIVPMRVLKTTIQVLDAPALAFHVALHAAHDVVWPKPRNDLKRASEQVGICQWREAAQLAERVDAVDAFGAGLRLVPKGEAVAAELRLPANRSRRVALSALGAPGLAVGLEDLSATAGVREKGSFVLGKICPPADFMRFISPLARKGRTGLALAYLFRPLSFLVQAVPALRAWRQAEKGTEGSRWSA